MKGPSGNPTDNSTNLGSKRSENLLQESAKGALFSLTGRRILVVDDDLDSAECMQMTLRMLGYEVVI